MRSAAVNILLVFILQGHGEEPSMKHVEAWDYADELLIGLVDHLVDGLVAGVSGRALKASSVDQADVDITSLAAPDPFATPRLRHRSLMNIANDCARLHELLSQASHAAPARLLSASPALTSRENLEQFKTMLGSLQSADNKERNAAEESYENVCHAQPSHAVFSLLHCMDQATTPQDVIRRQAATLLRRAVVNEASEKSPWGKVDESARKEIRQVLLNNVLMTEPNTMVRKVTVSLVANIAANEPEENTWLELVPFAFGIASCAEQPNLQESAMRIIGQVLSDQRYAKQIFDQRQALGTLISTGLTAPYLQAPAIQLVAEIVTSLEELEDDVSAFLQPVLPMVETAIRNLGSQSSNPALQQHFEDSLQQLIDCAQIEPTFFKPRYAEWVDLMLAFSGSTAISDNCRQLSLEWIASLIEDKPKTLAKAVPHLPQKAFAMSFEFLAQLEEDPGWDDVDDDDMDDDSDTMSLNKAGEEKVDFFADRFGFKKFGPIVMPLVQHYAASGRWQDKTAAAMGIRSCIEYVKDDTTVDNMLVLLSQLAQDPSKRVRYAALLGMGQASADLEPSFHKRWCSRMFPLLTSAVGDPVNRCAEMAIVALEALVDDLDDEDLLNENAVPMFDALVARLTSSTHKGVIFASLETLGSLASSMSGSFDIFYDKLMPILQNIISSSLPVNMPNLRGRIFETISFAARAVGKTKFAPAAKQTMALMLAPPQAGDDSSGLETESIRDAMEEICKILGADFAEFLPTLIPIILGHIRVESFMGSSTEKQDDSSEDMMSVRTESGLRKVRSTQITNVLAIVNLLTVVVKETGVDFLPYVPQTTDALGEILKCADPVLDVAALIREAVYPCWGEIVLIVSKAVPTHGQEAKALQDRLVQTMVEKVGADLVATDNLNAIAAMSNGLATIIRNAGAGCLQPAQAKDVSDLAVSHILKSFEREKNHQALSSSEDEDDDSDEDSARDGKGRSPFDDWKHFEMYEETDCRNGLVSLYGASIKANPDVFVSHSWPKLQPLLQEWRAAPNMTVRVSALNLASEICEHLKAQAVPIWPMFMDSALASVNAETAEERKIAAFTILLAAEVPEFGPQYGSMAYTLLEQALQRFRAKKNDEEGLHASDNVIAAFVQLLLSHPSYCSNLDGCWRTAFAKLPLKTDDEEAQKVHRKLFTEVMKPNGGNLNSMTRVARVLGYLCDVYSTEQVDQALGNDLAAAFANMQTGHLQALVSQFSVRQQRKAERVLQDGRREKERSAR